MWVRAEEGGGGERMIEGKGKGKGKDRREKEEGYKEKNMKEDKKRGNEKN